MSFSRGLGIAVLAAGIFSSCETPEPRDPRDSIPGNREYYNEALKFSLRYPRLLNLKVEDGEGVELDFGFFNVPDSISHKPLELEVGDAIKPPKAFVRRTIFKKLDDVVEDIGKKVNQHYA